MKANKLIIASIAAAALGAGAAYAGPGPQCSGPRASGPHMMHERGAASPPLRQLDLNQTQRNAIFDIKYKSMPKLREYHQQLRATRLALREATTSANYEAGKVRGLADQLGKLQADIAALRAADQHKIFAMLTPQQQAQLKQMREQRPRYAPHGQGFGPDRPRRDR